MAERPSECNGFCPKCGSDLAFSNLECVCKNPDCDWKCSDCKEKNDETKKQS